MSRKTINYSSAQAEKNAMKFMHSNPTARAAAEASPGNMTVKVRGKAKKISHAGMKKKASKKK